MHNPNSWIKFGAPLEWGILPIKHNMVKILEARDNREIELMIGFGAEIWYRRDLCEFRELGL